MGDRSDRPERAAVQHRLPARRGWPSPVRAVRAEPRRPLRGHPPTFYCDNFLDLMGAAVVRTRLTPSTARNRARSGRAGVRIPTISDGSGSRRAPVIRRCGGGVRVGSNLGVVEGHRGGDGRDGDSSLRHDPVGQVVRSDLTEEIVEIGDHRYASLNDETDQHLVDDVLQVSLTSPHGPPRASSDSRPCRVPRRPGREEPCRVYG